MYSRDRSERAYARTRRTPASSRRRVRGSAPVYEDISGGGPELERRLRAYEANARASSMASPAGAAARAPPTAAELDEVRAWRAQLRAAAAAGSASATSDASGDEKRERTDASDVDTESNEVMDMLRSREALPAYGAASIASSDTEREVSRSFATPASVHTKRAARSFNSQKETKEERAERLRREREVALRVLEEFEAKKREKEARLNEFWAMSKEDRASRVREYADEEEAARLRAGEVIPSPEKRRFTVSPEMMERVRRMEEEWRTASDFRRERMAEAWSKGRLSVAGGRRRADRAAQAAAHVLDDEFDDDVSEEEVDEEWMEREKARTRKFQHTSDVTNIVSDACTIM